MRLCCVPCCPSFREEGSKYCSKHRSEYEEKDNARYQEYLSRRYSGDRDDDSRKRKFYNSVRWRNLYRRLLQENPVCQCCGARESKHVHHAFPYRYDYWNEEDFYDESMLVCLCNECHSSIHEEMRNGTNSKVHNNDEY